VTGICDFVVSRLNEAEEALKLVPRQYRIYVYDDGQVREPETEERWDSDRYGSYRQDFDGDDIVPNRHQGYALLFDPDQTLREIAAKRRVLDRHCLYEGGDYHYCAGCPTGDETGYPDTELADCPELQDLAFIWNDHEDWDTRWCPHVEGRHETDVPELPPARGAYTNACNRCGTGDGWHYRKDRRA